MKKRLLLHMALAFGVLCLCAGSASALPVRVTLRTLAPASGTYLTPMWVGFHNDSFDMFDGGSAAPLHIERLAEDGDTGPLSTAFTISGVGSMDGFITGPVGPVAPGQTGSLLFDLDPMAASSRYLSYASMVIPSDDAFIANDNPTALPVFNPAGMFVGGTFMVLGSMVRDAGTEVNDELPMNTAFLGQMTPNTGVTENGVVMAHAGFIPGGNILSSPMFANADFTATGYQVAEITIEAIPEPGTMTLLAGPLLLLALRRYRRN